MEIDVPTFVLKSGHLLLTWDKVCLSKTAGFSDTMLTLSKKKSTFALFKHFSVVILPQFCPDLV